MSDSSQGVEGPRVAKPVIAVTSGDPAGVGPEIVVRFFSEFTPKNSVAVLIGAREALQPWLTRAGLDVPAVDSSEALGDALRRQNTPIAILHTNVGEPFPTGSDSAGGGHHAGRAIELACELAENCSIGGIVTAPISKKSLQLANFPFPGHTEMLARYLNAPHCQMMMVYNKLRVVPLTRHLPLRAVSDQITEEKIETCIRETVRALEKDFGLSKPRIGVAGLNPHAGDGGAIGGEEQDVIKPAIERLRAEGLDITGPLAADALFPLAYADCHRADGSDAAGEVVADGGREEPGGRNSFDTYISMYHDQGLVPFKMLAQRRGVNVTVGLPVVRTSVDHGVAFDIAGRGIAETESLRAAYKLAETLCTRRARGSSADRGARNQS